MADVNSLKDVFVALRHECMWLDASYWTFKALYESNESNKKLLSQTAPAFFMEHNQVLQQHCILHACKLTDSAETFGKRNLTFEQLNRMLESQGLLTDEIKGLTATMKRYRDLVVKSRHWMISHLDLAAVMSGQAVGAHDKEEWSLFLETMYKYTDVVGIAVGVGPLDYRVSTGPGDAYDLLRHLENSLQRGFE